MWCKHHYNVIIHTFIIIIIHSYLLGGLHAHARRHVFKMHLDLEAHEYIYISVKDCIHLAIIKN